MNFVVLISLMFWLDKSWADDAVVLVVFRDSPIEAIGMLDIRKAYFGLSVTVDGVSVRALRRRDDERLNQIFLQSVMAMSHRSYERRLLSLVLKFGTPRPVEVANLDALMQMLEGNRHAIAYVWKSEADADPRLRLIRVLWQEQ